MYSFPQCRGLAPLTASITNPCKQRMRFSCGISSRSDFVKKFIELFPPSKAQSTKIGCAFLLPKIRKGATAHAKKKLPQTVEECNAELERTQKLLQQYENRNKMLNRKLSAEKRKERNHRIFLFGGFMESIVPELKTMTEDEGKDFLYHIAKSTEAQEYLKKRAEGVGAG